MTTDDGINTQDEYEQRTDKLRKELSYGEDRPVAKTLTAAEKEAALLDPSALGLGTETFYHDPSTEWAIKKGYFIEIYHILSDEPVFFKAFLTDFSDTFSVNYNKEQVFGRSDPIQTYQNTERTISLAWDLVSSNLKEAKQNLIKANKIISMMYPSYGGATSPTDGGNHTNTNATNLRSGPLFKVKMGNLICKPGLSEEFGMSPAKLAGLGCTIAGFKYNPSIEDGFFDPVPGIFYPQTIKIDLELSILHEQVLGFDSNKDAKSLMPKSGANKDRPAFPYGGDMGEGVLNPVREEMPTNLINQYATTYRGDPGPFNVDEDGNRIGNVYIRTGEVRTGIEPGLSSFLELQKDLLYERARVQVNKILSPQDRRNLGKLDEFLFEDWTALF